MAVVGRGARIGSVFDEEVDHHDVTLVGCFVEGSEASGLPGIDFGAVIEQEVGDRVVPAGGRAFSARSSEPLVAIASVSAAAGEQ